LSSTRPQPARGDLDRALAEASAVLFLCTGNMVRSAFADLYARHLGCPLPVTSAATVYRNDHLLAETARALAERGVPADWIRSFRPRHVDDLLSSLPERTLILAMADMHLEALAGHPALRRRAFLLASLSGEPGAIADPVLDGADFAATFERVARGVEALIARLPRAPR
jgi:protein-tyrosine-phosphatase